MQLVMARFIRFTLALIGTGLLLNNSAHASDLSVAIGQAVKFTVTASGTQPFTYQWLKNSASISSANSDTYSIASATTADTASYTVVVTNSAGSITSTNATLTVNSSIVAPTITNQPASLTVTAGQSASFSVTASGSATLSYQWRKNGTAISGATSATYSIATTTSSAGSYSVVVTNSAGSITSGSATLTVNAAAVAPTIISQPTSLTVTAGQSVSFSVTASGSATLTYQWRKNGTAISGATSATYSIAATTTANAGSFTILVTNSAGSVTSGAAVLTVNPVIVAPVITSQPASLTVTAGQSASFSVTASGSATLTYQWLKNGAPISSATSSTYAIATATAADAATYSVIVSNSAGSTTSSGAVLTANSTTAAFSNGSFESPNVGANTFGSFKYNPTGTAWTFSSTTGVAGNNSGFTRNNPVAPVGAQVGYVQMTGSISQNVSFPAGSYTINALAAQRAHYSNQQVDVYVDGAKVGSYAPSGTAYTEVVTNAFTVTAGTHTIKFVGLTTVDTTLFIDNLTIQSATPSQVTIAGNGFETPNVGANTLGAFAYCPAGTPWTFTGEAGVSGNNSGFTNCV